MEWRKDMGRRWVGKRDGSVRSVRSRVRGGVERGVNIRRVRAVSIGRRRRVDRLVVTVVRRRVEVGEVELRIDGGFRDEGVHGAVFGRSVSGIPISVASRE